MIEGFKFLIVGAENKPINHGTIIEKVTEGKYLCQLQRKPASCRVVNVTEIEGWNLFPTEDAMNEFIGALTPAAPPADPKLKKKGKRNGKKSKKSKTTKK